jgi:hypothetical protein
MYSSEKAMGGTPMLPISKTPKTGKPPARMPEWAIHLKPKTTVSRAKLNTFNRRGAIQAG